MTGASLAIPLLTALLGSAAGADSANPAPDVRAALREGSYPWYDEDRDAVRPLMADPDSWTRWIDRRVESFLDWLRDRFGTSEESPRGGLGIGKVLPTILMFAGGGLFLFILWRLWTVHAPGHSDALGHTARIGDAARVAGLSPGTAMEGVDPWAEAQRRRALDPGGAVIWLFLDQLLSLQRAGIVRLVPGRTARQYAGTLSDPTLAGGLKATLATFEDVYYGHRLPTAATLEDVWSRAEGFRRRLKEIQGHD